MTNVIETRQIHARGAADGAPRRSERNPGGHPGGRQPALSSSAGIDQTRSTRSVDEAGVSKGTFYFYFRRKEDLLLEYGLRRLRRIREIAAGGSSGGSRSRGLN